jgi:hypothetical protein
LRQASGGGTHPKARSALSVVEQFVHFQHFFAIFLLEMSA